MVAKNGSYVGIGAPFFIDQVQGQFVVSFFPPTDKNGSGDGDYGEYGTGASVNAKIVGCAQEP